MTSVRRRPLRAVIAALIVAAALIAAPAASAATDRDADEAPAPRRTATPTPTPTETPEPEDPTRAAEYWLEDYGIEEAWETTRGAGTTIAVIDSGVAADIDELEDAVVGGTDVSGVGTPDGRTPLGSDVHIRSHGTWVASLAGARGTSEDEGMIGVAPEANILAVSLGFGSVSEVPFSKQVADAIRWSVDNGADVINLSFTTNQTAWDESWDDAFGYAFDHDVVVVVAAGNRASGTTVVGAPATIPEVLVVGGVTPSGRASREASTQGVTIGVSAPSEQLIGIGPTGAIDPWRGTSGAAPIVSGIAALVKSAHPDLDANNIINRIVATAEPAPLQEGDRDPIYGFGIIDAARAVSETGIGLVDANPVSDQSLTEWIRRNRAADGPGEVDAGSTPTPAPVELPALPPPDPPAEAGDPLLPSPDSLREVTLPLVAVTAAGILVVLGAVAVTRRIRSLRAHRESGS
ncbi:S8 family serine peptidase [Microbacterium karelineae]|uniref:S8 family serine peptidase n=1 Tax=Microbacterium karelineae TaxID=2654283 RepID=UPI0012EAF1FA|nr:S8 family serine peptidase [Microbacterium karelineae]